jgi:O-antigen/teichoic acid export membrane protein
VQLVDSTAAAGTSTLQKPPETTRPTFHFSIGRAYTQSFLATVVVRLFGVFSGILTARLLGPTGRGELGVISFFPLMLSSVGELELPRAIAYECSKRPGRSCPFVTGGFWLALAFGLMQSVLLAGVMPWLLPSDKTYLLPACLCFAAYLPAFYLNTFLTGADQGRGWFGRMSAIQVLPGLIYVLAVLLVWRAHRSSSFTFAMSILAGAWLPALLRVVLEHKAILRSMPERAATKLLLKRALAFYGPAVAALVLSRADTFLLIRLVPTTAIGLYAVGQAVALGQIGAVTPFISVGFTAVASQSDPRLALVALTRQFRLAQLVALAIGSCTALAVPYIIRAAFGTGFVGATSVTYFLIGSAGLWGVSQLLDQGLRAMGHTRPGIASNVLGLLCLLVFGIGACRRFGILGLAASVLTAQFVNLLALVVFVIARVGASATELFALTPRNLTADLRSACGGLFRTNHK